MTNILFKFVYRSLTFVVLFTYVDYVLQDTLERKDYFKTIFCVILNYLLYKMVTERDGGQTNRHGEKDNKQI